MSGIVLVSSLTLLPVFSQDSETSAKSTPAEPSEIPSLEASVLFRYYEDLDAAKRWYEHDIGWEKVADYGWAAVFKITPTSYLGLTTADEDAPRSKKSSSLNISTSDLAAWHARLAKNPDIKFLNHIEMSAGLVEQFRVEDPGGYSLEFFRWDPDSGQEHVVNPFEK